MNRNRAVVGPDIEQPQAYTIAQVALSRFIYQYPRRSQCRFEQNLATVRFVYEGFNTGNVPLLLSLVTEDFELADVALGISWHGRQGWGEWLQNWATSMPDAQVHLETITARVAPWSQSTSAAAPMPAH